ncbi:MAG: hypothetical protein WC592_02515 [Candidatus Omnitrophota bacterium]
MTKSALIITSIVLLVLFLGVIIGLVTNYLVRNTSTELESSSSLPEKNVVPARVAEPEPALPASDESYQIYTPKSGIEPVEKTALIKKVSDTQELKDESFKQLETALPPQVATSPVIDSPEVSQQSAPSLKTLPAFTPIKSATGPVLSEKMAQDVPDQSAYSLPVATLNKTAQQTEVIHSFVPRSSSTGPVSDKPAAQLPPFTPVPSTTGPAQTKLSTD